MQGWLGGSVLQVSDIGSGHDLTVHGFEPSVRLCVDNQEPGAASDSVSLSLCPSSACVRAHSLFLKNK